MAERESNALIYWRPEHLWWDTVVWSDTINSGDTPYARALGAQLARDLGSAKWEVKAKPPPYTSQAHRVIATGISEDEAKHLLEIEVTKMRLTHG